MLKRVQRLKITRKPNNKTKTNLSDFSDEFDVFGSYTGVDYTDKYEVPVQDADDL